MRPTLEEIFEFGFTRIDRGIQYRRGKEYPKYEHVKRYLPSIVYYVAHIYYNYPISDIAEYLNLKPLTISSGINRIKNINSKVAITEELFDSLEYLHRR